MCIVSKYEHMLGLRASCELHSLVFNNGQSIRSWGLNILFMNAWFIGSSHESDIFK